MNYSGNNRYRLILLAVLCLGVFLWGADAPDEHAGHDHSEHAAEVEEKAVEEDHSEHDHSAHAEEEEEKAVEEDHSEHDHSEHAEEVEEKAVEEDHSGHDHGEDDQSDEMKIKLSAQAVKLADIKMDNVKNEKLGKVIELPGEIGFNEDETAHITPRFAGVTKEVKAHIGEFVHEGDILAVIESNESFTEYNVIAPFDGHIVEKHITKGEFAGEEEPIFVISNMNTVWVNCEVYPHAVKYLKKGQRVKINAVGMDLKTIGRISYISPVFNQETRSAVARIQISSNNMKWRPGLFIYASIERSSDKKVPVVSNNAVQVLNDKNVIFIQEAKNVFEPVEVELGMSDDTYTEIKSGIKPGDSYVASGAFELKAKLVTSALGDHAGHGH